MFDIVGNMLGWWSDTKSRGSESLPNIKFVPNWCLEPGLTLKYVENGFWMPSRDQWKKLWMAKNDFYNLILLLCLDVNKHIIVF